MYNAGCTIDKSRKFVQAIVANPLTRDRRQETEEAEPERGIGVGIQIQIQEYKGERERKCNIRSGRILLALCMYSRKYMVYVYFIYYREMGKGKNQRTKKINSFYFCVDEWRRIDPLK